MFIVVRHGNTFDADTLPRRIGARTDLPLTGKGVAQAHALGALFAGKGIVFDRVLVSPLIRTRSTVSAILTFQSSPPEPEPASFLREIDYGPDEDQIEETVLGRIGEKALAAWEAHAKVPPGWIVEPETRIKAWKRLFANTQSDTNTLLVTSNGAARFALLADPKLREQAAKLQSLKLPTGGYGVIERRDDGGLSLQNWGMRP